MTLQELKTKATASELTLIERVEALVAEASNTEQIRADAVTKVQDELRAIWRKTQETDLYHNRTETEMLGMAVYKYLKENP